MGAFVTVDPTTNAPVVVPGTQGTGVFPNRSGPDNPGYVTNAHGTQLAYIETVPGNELSQVISDTFLAGHTYWVTAGLVASLFEPPTAGDSVTIGLFYSDGVGRHIISSTTAVYGTSPLGQTFETDYFSPALTLPATDAAVGHQIGVVLSASGSGFGFFDLDNVRVTPEPGMLSLSLFSGVALLLRRRTQCQAN